MALTLESAFTKQRINAERSSLLEEYLAVLVQHVGCALLVLLVLTALALACHTGCSGTD